METEGEPGVRPSPWGALLGLALAVVLGGCCGGGRLGGRVGGELEAAPFARGRTTDPGTRFLPVGRPEGGVTVETPPFGWR